MRKRGRKKVQLSVLEKGAGCGWRKGGGGGGHNVEILRSFVVRVLLLYFCTCVSKFEVCN